jgi:Flp pilus assembly pilin Flp
MFDMIKFAAKAAAGDRKGITALEYALIAAAVVAILIGGYRGLFTNLAAFTNSISFD